MFYINDLQATEYEVVFDGTRTPIVSDHFGIKVVLLQKQSQTSRSDSKKQCQLALLFFGKLNR